MWGWLDRLGLVLFDASLSTAILSSFVILAMLMCRQPSRRISIARAGLIASLSMMPVVAFAPLPRLYVMDGLVRSGLVPDHVIHHWEQARGPAAAVAPGFAPVATSRSDPDPTSRFWPGPHAGRGLTLLVAAGMGLAISWLLIGFLAVRRIVRHAQEPSSHTQERYDALLAELAKPRRCPALRVTPRITQPVVVVGVGRATILIPPDLDEVDSNPNLVKLCLLHEIAHAARSDAWFGTLAGVAQAIWFYLPQTWWLRSQLLIDQEFMADRAAALRFGTTSAYAASLLSLADSRLDRPEAAPRSGQENAGSLVRESERRSPLFQRVLMLLYCPFRVESAVSRWWSLALRLTVAVASIAAACLCLRWPDARAIEERLKHASTLTSDPFRVTDFIAEPLVVASGGRAVPHVLPIVLPDQFDLRVEVLASTIDLPRIRIAGFALGAATPAVGSQESLPPDRTESWHRVRLRRQGDGVSLSVDGDTVSLSLRAGDAGGWLTFEPSPERPAGFRNLVVEW
jgi:beta-lactamase regulating signal transducer with metallopeptidase domain